MMTTFDLKKLETSLYYVVQNTFQYLESFRHDHECDGQTGRWPLATARSNIVICALKWQILYFLLVGNCILATCCNLQDTRVVKSYNVAEMTLKVSEGHQQRCQCKVVCDIAVSVLHCF